ncbi:MAG: DegT/DnrJ/EryC1/StrS family aminotransferase [Chitinophagales bacterium]
MLQVSKVFLSPPNDLNQFLERIWQSGVVTNNGPLVQQLENRVKSMLGVKHVFFVANGTIGLQLALRTFGESGSVVTTPFSAVPSITALNWQHYKPVFADIRPTDFCLDVDKLPNNIPVDTKGILATHVFGTTCDIDSIQKYAAEKSLPVIYDASHAFGSSYKGKEIMQFGDIVVFSTHAYKIFNTIEGGFIVTGNDDTARQLYEMRYFGLNAKNEIVSEGTNAKNSELHAAIGLCNLKYVPQLLEQRKAQWQRYEQLFEPAGPRTITISDYSGFNYAYYPVIFATEDVLLKAINALAAKGYASKRYFYPSLNNVHYLSNYQSMPVSEFIASRILCLPLHHEVSELHQQEIAEILMGLVIQNG